MGVPHLNVSIAPAMHILSIGEGRRVVEAKRGGGPWTPISTTRIPDLTNTPRAKRASIQKDAKVRKNRYA